jgi:RNA polymerase sigma-54 factor
MTTGARLGPSLSADLRLGQALRQRLGLSGRVLGALAVLRLPAAELAEMLLAEAATNPFLRAGPPPARATATALDPELLGAAEPSWQLDLMRQLAQMPLSGAVLRLAARLVAELDERGWLDVPLAEIAARDGLDPAELEAALAAVQACDPAGVGARDLNECLTLQLVDLGLSRDEARATLAELPRFARRDRTGLMRALDLDAPALEARAALLRRLDPDPVGARAAPLPAPLVPDLVLVRNPTGPDRVELAAEHLPAVRLDSALAERAHAEGFGADLLARALELMRAVEGRGRTLQRVGEWLVRRQEAALRLGPGALRPASRTDCAAELGLHPSTVGRAAAGKALVADGRLWPLATLFSGPAGADREGPAARAAAHRIAALIAAEPADRPLSDGRLAERLSREGVDIARRTVAKYRNGLRIPPAHLRRQGRWTGG